LVIFKEKIEFAQHKRKDLFIGVSVTMEVKTSPTKRSRRDVPYDPREKNVKMVRVLGARGDSTKGNGKEHNDTGTRDRLDSRGT